MLDKQIPYRNMIMKWDGMKMPQSQVRLPEGYSFRAYGAGDAEQWVKIQMEAGEFLEEGAQAAAGYFIKQYEARQEDLKDRCFFAVNHEGNYIGTCTAWTEADQTPSLHWLAVSGDAQGQGIGYAMILEAMRIFQEKGEIPVFLHTQPWSYRAVRLYLRAGFRFCRRETFGGYENQCAEAVEILKTYIRIREDAWG